MRLVFGDGPGEDMTGAGRRLEASSAPTAIDVEARYGRPTDDRRTVWRNIDNAAPAAQHTHPPKRWEQLADRIVCMNGDMKAAALAI